MEGRERIEAVLRGGDEGNEAFRAIYEEYSPRIKKALRRLLGDEGHAQDALEETFMRLHGAIGSVARDDEVYYFAKRIAKNVARSHHATLRRRPFRRFGQDPAAPGDPIDALERDLDIQDALSALRPDQQRLIKERHRAGRDLEDLAAEHGCTKRTIHTKLEAAVRALNVELRARGIFPGDDSCSAPGPEKRSA